MAPKGGLGATYSPAPDPAKWYRMGSKTRARRGWKRVASAEAAAAVQPSDEAAGSMPAPGTPSALVESASTETYSLTPSQERLLRAVLADFQLADARSIGLVLAQTASLQAVQPRWEALVRESRPHAANMPLLVRAVLREAFHEANREVQVYREQVLFHQEMMDAVQREMRRIEGERSLSPEGEREWDSYSKKLSEWLGSLEEDAERADADLRKALEGREHKLAALSELAVALQETGMAVIR